MSGVLLMTSNGTGMGHLTRMTAVGLTLPADRSPVLLSLSLGLPTATGLGIPGEYCPSYDRPWIASSNWNSYLRDRVTALVEETRSEVVVFDGVSPYSGIAKAAQQLRDVAFVWLRRGMWKEGNERALARGRFFDLVIEPGDLAAASDRGPTAELTDARRVGPISIIEPVGVMPRDQARSALGLPADGPVALVTLGSGRLGDVAEPGQAAVRALLEDPAWHIAVTRSPIARNEVGVAGWDRITELSEVYPLARYLPAFDVAISSAGYNAVHELVPAGVPSLLVANTSTKTDDQGARARGVEAQGLALAVDDTDPGAIGGKVRELIDDAARGDMAQRAASTRELMTGAGETGRLATAFGDEFETRRLTVTERISTAVQDAKDLVRSALGEERTTRVKEMLGRRPTPVHHRASVRLLDGWPAGESPDLPLVVTEELTGADLRRDHPVEHLLGGSSPGYRDRRLEIVSRYYDIVP